MQSLQDKASEWSGVAKSDAFAIDETNLFESLGGIEPFIDLSTNFYTRFAICFSSIDLVIGSVSDLIVGEIRGIIKIVRLLISCLD
jgi:hypothetical protein